MVPRRARLLAGVVVFVLVALYYTNRGSVEPYKDYVTEKTVGGGAVLRPEGAGGIDVQDATVRATWVGGGVAETKAAVRQSETPRATWVYGGASPATSASSEIAPSSTAVVGLPAITDDDDNANVPLPVDGQGRKEPDSLISDTTAPTIHWSSQTEHFPISSTIQLPRGTPVSIPRIQYSGPDPGRADLVRLAAVKKATEHAWRGYRGHAWADDELKPLSGGSTNPFMGWGATLVDSLDTLYLMNLTDFFNEAVEQVAKIDFTTTARADIPLFETTIRYLGGLIAAYDVSDAKHPVLLEKAVELAEILYASFDTPNRMPQTYYRWKPAFASQPHRATNRVVLAELGSLSLEFTRLAQLTGEPKYYDAVARITDALEAWQDDTRLPGMWPTVVDASGCKKPGSVSPAAGKPPQHQQLIPGGNGEMMEAGKPVQGGKAQQQQTQGEAEMDLTMSRPRPGTPKEEKGKDSTSNGQAKAELDGYGIGNYRVKRQLSSDEIDEDVSHESSKTNGTADPSKVKDIHSWRLPKDSNTPVPAKKDDTCVPQGLASTSTYVVETFTLGGQSDSVYEYLPKMHLLLSGRAAQYKSLYLSSVATIKEHLLFRPMTPDNADILVSGAVKATINHTSQAVVRELVPENEHLTCFAGGMFALGGKLFNKPEDVEIGKKLTEGCVWAYESTATGLMPEAFTLARCEGAKNATEGCEWDEESYGRQLDPDQATRLAVHGGKSAAGVHAIGQLDSESSDEPVAEDLVIDSDAATQDVPADTAKMAALPAVEDLEKRQIEAPSSTTSLSASTTATKQTQPKWTPPPPLPHAEFVAQKIATYNLPPAYLTIRSSKYILRPEAIESVFYLYRITNDPHWRDVGWRMFLSIQAATETEFGNAGVDDVLVKEGDDRAAGLKDTMESFWIAETLKYFYLLFEDPSVWALDEWVLNTEAHAFRRT